LGLADGKKRERQASLWSMWANHNPCRQNHAITQTKRKAQMKTIVYHNYGSPDDVLELYDTDKLVVKDKEVLV
jgi:hypothetical protein